MKRASDNLRTWSRQFDNYQYHHRWVGFMVAVTKKHQGDKAGQLATLFTYYGFLALFPLLLVLTTVLKLVLRSNNQLRAHIMHDVIVYFPIIGNDLQQNIHGYGDTGLALAIGLILTIFGARSVAAILHSSLDDIWRVPHKRQSSFLESLLKNLATIVVGSIGLIMAPALAGYVFVFGNSIIFRCLFVIFTVLVLFWVIVLIIKTSVSVSLTLKEIWIGSLVAAICLAVLQSLGGYILARELRNLNSLYGTFAVVLGLLYWIYLQAQVIFYVFELDSVRSLKLWPVSIKKNKADAVH